MIGPISVKAERELFNYLTKNSEAIAKEVQAIQKMGLTEKDIFIKTIMECATSDDPAIRAAVADVQKGLRGQFDLATAIQKLKSVIPNEAAMMEDADGGKLVMAKGWKMPVLFENVPGFKWLGFADEPTKLTTEGIWTAAHGEKPAVILGGIGNSNIKPEQVLGGCSLSKKELSAQYEQAIVDFFTPIFKYFEEIGVNIKESFGFGLAHSYCGVDKATRDLAETFGIRIVGTTPTEYTQYIKGTPKALDILDGAEALVADFPHPTILTRNISQISDYGTTYGKIIGENNPILVANGGGHAWVEDSGKAIIGLDGSTLIPANLVKDKLGYVIPATTGEGKDKVVTNTAQLLLEKVDGNPFERYKFAFEQYLPSSRLKEDIAQYDPQMAMTTHIHGLLSKAGLIPKQ